MHPHHSQSRQEDQLSQKGKEEDTLPPAPKPAAPAPKAKAKDAK